MSQQLLDSHHSACSAAGAIDVQENSANLKGVSVQTSSAQSTVDTYLELALRPDIEALADLVLAEVEQTGSIAVYDSLLQPALEEVGRRWERDELTVADEHLVTALTEQVLTRMRRRSISGPMAVVACTPDNAHRVGAVMVADTMALAGWNAVVLGAHTPLEDLATLCTTRDARMIALSVGIEDELGQLEDELRQLRSRIDVDVPILIGGGALRRHVDWAAPDGVVVCTSVTDLLTLARSHLPEGRTGS